jgi:hypothetical protein
MNSASDTEIHGKLVVHDDLLLEELRMGSAGGLYFTVKPDWEEPCGVHLTGPDFNLFLDREAVRMLLAELQAALAVLDT